MGHTVGRHTFGETMEIGRNAAPGLRAMADPARRVAPPAGYPGSGTVRLDPDGSTFVSFTAELSGARSWCIRR